jgi:hypothetical protein
MCTVYEVNPAGTELKAICPPKENSEADIEWIDNSEKIIDSNKVKVFGRIIEEAVYNCANPANCVFTYDSSVTPSLSSYDDINIKKG